jgi:glycosyltransferase involved in cell wall biosynthesis
MHLFWTFFFGLIALLWLVQSIRVARGMRTMPEVRNAPALPDAECPFVSILFSARDEAEKLPTALATLLALDYPRYEVVAVNDRSSDATGPILDEFATRDARLKVVHIAELPSGWLGKPHGLLKAYEASTGEWLVFTDADVRFAPDVLRRALGLARARNWDHLTLLGAVDMHGFWECVLLTFFMLGFTLYIEAWRVADPKSNQYCGVGAFQLLRRSTYEAIGTHTRLRMEVIDDVKLGKLVKLGGHATGVASAWHSIAVRWHAGLGGIINGTTKNFFASANFNLAFLGAQLAGLFLLEMVPFAALFFTRGWTLAFAAAACLLGANLQAAAARRAGVSSLYGLTMPLGAAIFAYMLLRSTYFTLRQGGIVWRDTFYPLEELRKGLI